jgi:glycosyltransferase involved in cell wall biosynthesis
MKILWACYSRILELDIHLSGVEKLQRLQYLAKSGHEVFMVAGDFKKEYAPKSPNLHIIRIPLRYLPVVSPLLYGLFLFFFLPFYLVKIRPDFVITDPSTTCFVIWKPVLSKILDFKMILDIRSTIVDPHLRGKAYFDISILIAKIMFDGMTIVTPMMRDEVCQKFLIAPDWVGILSNGVSDELLNYDQSGVERTALRERFGLSDKFVVLYHGAFRSDGGLIESVEAMGAIKMHRSDIVLFLLGRGDPSLISLLKRKIKESNVEDIVFLHEPVPFNEVPKYISMSDVGLVPLPNSPAWRNQQPNKLLEYMAMKKPIIVSESPAHRLVLGNSNAAIFVSHVVPIELAAAMEYACDNRDKLNQYGETGRDIVSKKFAWKRVNEDFVTYLLNVRLGKNGRANLVCESR